MKLPTFENPLKLFTPSFAGSAQGSPGLNSGNMMFASSGSGSGGGGYDDDDDYGFDDDYNFDDEETPEEEPSGQRPQSNRTRRSAGRANARGGRSRSTSIQPDERYWTDYLRIALPVIGIILMLGLLWVWASSLLGDDSSDVDTPEEDTVGLVETLTPDPNAVNTEPNAAGTPAPSGETEGPGTTGGEIPISGQTTAEPTNPPFNPSATEAPADGGDNQAGDDGEADDPPADTGEIAVDDRVEITEPLNVRPSAGTSGDPLWVAEAGDQGTVISGPEEADGYTWWELVFDNGSAGFVIEEFLEVVP